MKDLVTLFRAIVLECHRLGGLRSTNLFLTVVEPEKSNIKVPISLVLVRVLVRVLFLSLSFSFSFTQGMCGSSWARVSTHATAVTQTVAVTTPAP